MTSILSTTPMPGASVCRENLLIRLSWRNTVSNRPWVRFHRHVIDGIELVLPEPSAELVIVTAGPAVPLPFDAAVRVLAACRSSTD